MAFTSIPSGAVDAESPLDSVLFGYVKDNDDYLKARLVTGSGHTHNQAGTDEGGPVTPADGSVTTVKIAVGAVTWVKLSTNRGSYSSSTGATHYISINRYSHLPSAQKTGTLTNLQLLLQSRNGQSWAASETTEVTAILEAGSSETFTIYWDFHVN